ncbi:ABC transporter ATP-binding protein [Cloacibacterium rupense]|uniref:ABC transporter ATP-binding protein n=1 Tax=Cloacibacterium rupense TaxID=517423 RepID=A0ABQ2NHL8_9FLAO|nr:ABC transporter ATP-binding protein [Cloacibacterium rupense]GGP03062.1 ABC transporter ATP-binding protein [Cloacibacterium rupense]
MSNIVIKAENISKQYRLGQVGTGTIAHDLNRFWHQIRGKEDPYLKIGEANDRSTKGSSDYVWSLQDINFEIEQGDAVGIIGRNGAGKSTLLKLLSRVTKPTTGKIYTQGRIASLLEVGTGFHPEMTGRENIYLNGAILGMTRKEITRKFDEIVDFSGVERYIDTPVKRYSSGMYVRLAFAVAAHLESEILIVDEVLAVGDAEFQKKCLGKMGDVSKGEGRTILFVSHQMGAISTLCKKCLLLEKGKVINYGKTNSIIEEYLSPSNGQLNNSNSYIAKNTLKSNKNVFFKSIDTFNSRNIITDSFGFNEHIKIKINLSVKNDIKNIILGIGIQDKFNVRVATFMNELSDLNINPISKDNWEVVVELPKEVIAPNSYSFIFALYIYNGEIFDIIENVCPIKIYDTGTIFSKYEGLDYGNIIVKADWKVN